MVNMTVHAQVEGLANAYRRAMADGDRELAGSAIERKLLHALVAASAADTARWVKTRVEDGSVAVAPLDDLLPALREGEPIGPGLEAAKKQLGTQARAMANAVIFGAAWPAWTATAVAFVVGALGFSYDAGAATGKALFGLVLGGGSVLFAFVRTLSIAGPKAAEAVSGAAGSLWSWVDGLGLRAEGVVQRAAGPALDDLYRGAPRPAGPTVTQQVRGSAKVVVGLTYGALAIAGLVFAFGMYEAFSAAASVPATCSLHPSDPGCR